MYKVREYSRCGPAFGWQALAVLGCLIVGSAFSETLVIIGDDGKVFSDPPTKSARVLQHRADVIRKRMRLGERIVTLLPDFSSSDWSVLGVHSGVGEEPAAQRWAYVDPKTLAARSIVDTSSRRTFAPQAGVFVHDVVRWNSEELRPTYRSEVLLLDATTLKPIGNSVDVKEGIYFSREQDAECIAQSKAQWRFSRWYSVDLLALREGQISLKKDASPKFDGYGNNCIDGKQLYTSAVSDRVDSLDLTVVNIASDSAVRRVRLTSTFINTKHLGWIACAFVRDDLHAICHGENYAATSRDGTRKMWFLAVNLMDGSAVQVAQNCDVFSDVVMRSSKKTMYVLQSRKSAVTKIDLGTGVCTQLKLPADFTTNLQTNRRMFIVD